MTVKVQIGTGSFNNFAVQIDTSWPVLPREGETIVSENGGEADIWKVRCVRFIVGRQQTLNCVQVLVSRLITDASLPKG